MQAIDDYSAEAPATFSEAETARLVLSGTATMKDLKAAFLEMRMLSTADPALLSIDLSDVNYILVECLMALIAEISRRQTQGLTTKLRVPRSNQARAFIREWDFPRAIKRVTGINFYDLVDPQDRHYFQGLGGDGGIGADRHYKIYKSYHWRDEIWKVPVDTNRFFGFRTWDVIDYRQSDDPLRFKRAVLDECERWTIEPVIEAVLRASLGPFYKYLPSHVIHEAMSNAFRHGGARSVVAVSKADFDASYIGKTRFLTLVFWDNGQPMHGILKHALGLKRPITSNIYGATPELRYDVRVNAERLTCSSTVIPHAESRNEEFLLATLFPGVTSDPGGAGHFTHPAVSATDELGKFPGNGLANLVNAAVDIFHGSVAIRSGSYFMNVTRPKKLQSGTGGQPNYSVKIEDQGPSEGNMVTIRLPLRGAKLSPAPA